MGGGPEKGEYLWEPEVYTDLEPAKELSTEGLWTGRRNEDNSALARLCGAHLQVEAKVC